MRSEDFFIIFIFIICLLIHNCGSAILQRDLESEPFPLQVLHIARNGYAVEKWPAIHDINKQ